MSPWKPYQWRIGVSYQARALAARSLCVSHEEITSIDSHQETQGRVYFTFSLFLQPCLSFILPSPLHAIYYTFEKALQSDVTRENGFTALCDKAKNTEQNRGFRVLLPSISQERSNETKRDRVGFFTPKQKEHN